MHLCHHMPHYATYQYHHLSILIPLTSTYGMLLIQHMHLLDLAWSCSVSCGMPVALFPAFQALAALRHFCDLGGCERLKKTEVT